MLFTFAAQCFSQMGVLANYEINKTYIAKVLCVNRDKPAMHCDGKCYLKKKLQQDQQRKDSENGNMGSKPDVLLFCSDNTAFNPNVLESAVFTFPLLKSHNYTSPHFRIFHPPCA